jgi:hypothetical protein
MKELHLQKTSHASCEIEHNTSLNFSEKCRDVRIPVECDGASPPDSSTELCLIKELQDGVFNVNQNFLTGNTV